MPSTRKQPHRQALEKPGFAPARPARNKKFPSNELLNPARRGRTWTPEQRAAQAAKIRRWRPWAQSTGPKTAQGKARAAQNALKHGSYSALERKLKRLLREQLAFVRMVEAHLRLLRFLRHCERSEAIQGSPRHYKVPRNNAPKTGQNHNFLPNLPALPVYPPP
jgi:hypothetical protein